MTPAILLDVPECMESERLLLRCPLPGDGAAVNEAIRESIQELRPWLPWARRMESAEETEANVVRARGAYMDRTDLRMHIFLKDTGKLVGSSGLHRMDWEVPRFEIGYWCRTSCTGNGYITEAVRRITALAFCSLRANRVEIRAAAANLRSQAVAE